MTQPIYSTSANPMQVANSDPDWDIACERMAWFCPEGSCGGQNPAEWIMWSACPCNQARLYCTHCRNVVLALPVVLCRECMVTFSPGSTAYRMIEPLNRRSQS